jgi:hypothetical protein
MSDNANRLRERARQCRILANGVNRQTDRKTLERLGAELDAEARTIEAHEHRERDLSKVNL